jgi:DNA polymerase-1
MINFGLVYGMTEYGYASRLRIPVDEAQAYIAQYMARLPKVSEYIARTIEEARVTGRVATLFGRIRLMPELASANQQVRRAAERRAINMPVQGTAADIMKLAMIKVAERMGGENSPAKLLLQVHDELVLEVPRQHLDEAAALLKSAMEDVVPLAVPLTVSLKVGPNWADQAVIS